MTAATGACANNLAAIISLHVIGALPRAAGARAERAAAKDGEDADSDEDDDDDDERGEGQPELTVGEQVTVTVRRMLDFGAFCALEGGYEVLLPVGEMGLKDEDEEDMEDKFEEGQELVARVLSIRGPQVWHPSRFP